MKRFPLLLPLVIGLLLSACSSPAPSSSTQSTAEQPSAKQSAARTTSLQPTLPPATPTQAPAAEPAQPAGEQAIQLPELSDSQGAVTVVVKPLDLDPSQATLSFEVYMDTHSVDLSMDLAALATLTTDNGRTVQAELWDAPQGGHHVAGRLTFPASVEGKALLDGASKLTLVIRDVDALERIFAWDLK